MFKFTQFEENPTSFVVDCDDAPPTPEQMDILQTGLNLFFAHLDNVLIFIKNTEYQERPKIES